MVQVFVDRGTFKVEAYLIRSPKVPLSMFELKSEDLLLLHLFVQIS